MWWLHGGVPGGDSKWPVCQALHGHTTIWAAFWKSGIWPIDCNIFTNTDFAPSNDTSTTACNVPDSYPVCTNDEWPGHQSWSDDDPMPDLDDDERSSNDENSNANNEIQWTHQLADPTPSVRGHRSFSLLPLSSPTLHLFIYIPPHHLCTIFKDHTHSWRLSGLMVRRLPRSRLTNSRWLPVSPPTRTSTASDGLRMH
jgi:hypothetical protein